MISSFERLTGLGPMVDSAFQLSSRGELLFTPFGRLGGAHMVPDERRPEIYGLVRKCCIWGYLILPGGVVLQAIANSHENIAFIEVLAVVTSLLIMWFICYLQLVKKTGKI